MNSVNAKPGWLKALQFAGVAMVLAAALTLAYGIFKFPDAPIRQTATGVVGKTGLPHTREDYELFELWERSVLVVVPLAFAVCAAAVIAEKRNKKRNGPGG
jgi:hypothetical protein